MAGQRVRGSELAGAFASLRANELVWNYVVNNYLKGETPPAFDLLYWNGDSANLPGPMYVDYMRNMYLDNKLREPGALTMSRRADRPRAHHACPRTSSPRAKTTSCRGASAYRTHAPARRGLDVRARRVGHIAGVVNPPARKRRNYWTNDAHAAERRRVARACDESCRAAGGRTGSAWLARHAGGRARRAGDLRQRRIPAARAGAGSLRRGSGRLSDARAPRIRPIRPGSSRP